MVTSTPASSKFSGWPAVGRAELAEALDVVDRRPLVAGQIEQGVDQHRAVAGRQDEAVAVGPVRVGRVELQMPGEQRGRGVGHAHRHARMAAVGGLHRIHREGANGVGEAAVGRLHRGSGNGVRCRPGLDGGGAAPLSGEPCRVNACPESPKCVANEMDDGGLSTSFGPRRARARSGSSGRSPIASRPTAATMSFAPRSAKRSPSSTS